jgi:ketopantoate reductase
MRDLVIYGVGELGQLYGAAALRAGIRVTPITRSSDPKAVLATVSSELPILVAVGESALDEVLAGLKGAARERLIVLQNELFPSQWRRHGVAPTVLVPWLLKKRGMPLLVARPSPIYGKFAALVTELHDALGIPSTTLASAPELEQAIIEKYAFILAINALGMLRDRTLAVWLQEDPVLVRALTDEAAQLGAALCESNRQLDLSAARATVEGAMRALGAMTARGRSAQARVARALEHGQRLGIALPELSAVTRRASLH